MGKGKKYKKGYNLGLTPRCMDNDYNSCYNKHVFNDISVIQTCSLNKAGRK